MFIHIIIITVLWYHSLPDIWKCASIDEVLQNHRQELKPLSANPIKWSNTPKQFAKTADKLLECV